jgi:hypothetical protein
MQQEIKAASAASYSSLFIGQDRAGHWVVKDKPRECRDILWRRKPTPLARTSRWSGGDSNL